MRSRFFILLGVVLACPSVSLGADPAVSTAVPERAESASPAIPPPAQSVNEKPKPVERPKPVEKPRLVEKPRPVVENVRPPEVIPGKPVEPPAPAAVPAPVPAADPGKAGEGEAKAGYSFGCLALSFAMLIIGIAAGFLGRHFLSRHKLGGMTVRIGTWRGIP